MILQFEDIVRFTDHEFRDLLREITNEDITYALDGSSIAFRSKVHDNLTKRCWDLVYEDSLGPPNPAMTAQAKERITAKAKEMIGRGDIKEPDLSIPLKEESLEQLVRYEMKTLPPFDLMECDTEQLLEFWRKVLVLKRKYGELPPGVVEERLQDRFSRAIYGFPEGEDAVAGALLKQVEQRLEVMRLAAVGFCSGKTTAQAMDIYQNIFPYTKINKKYLKKNKPDPSKLNDLDGTLSSLIENILYLFTICEQEGSLALEEFREQVPGYLGVCLGLVVDSGDFAWTMKTVDRMKKTFVQEVGLRLELMAICAKCVHDSSSVHKMEVSVMACGPDLG